jgi:OOP family OmpA-OmpF porin
MRVAISGHTDNVGDRVHNVELSKQRADSVKTYLVGQGVEASRIDTRGAGPDEPIADNKQAAGRQKNRRIEFKMLSP